MRGLALVVAALTLLVSASARAQLDQPVEHPQDSDSEPQPSASPWSRYQSKVRAYPPSPEWTQDRFATSTRFWLLDPGVYEVQMWFRTRVPHVDPMTGVRGPAEVLWQHEIEIGLFPHIQLDLYENLTLNVDDSGRRFESEGARAAGHRVRKDWFSSPIDAAARAGDGAPGR